jgi:hypothetical protein
VSCEPWPLVSTCLPDGWLIEPDMWSEEQDQAVRAAAELLQRMSGQQYGLCTIKVRPCRRVPLRRPTQLDQPWTMPVLFDGRLMNLTCGCASATECGCAPLCEVLLDGPVHDIVEVKQDGVALGAGSYRVDNRRLLVRTDGSCWPDCQDLSKADTEPGTWSVTYRRGRVPGAAGSMALTLLAIELDKACRNDESCRLPRRAVEVVREGITYSFDQDTALFSSGRTGISRVDLWLAAVNPYSVHSPMAVYSPDTVRSRRQTFPAAVVSPPIDGAVSRYHYTYVQPTPALVWTIVHNLGYRPAGIQIVNTTAPAASGFVSYPDENTVRLTFSAPTSGTAYLS